MNVEQIKAEYIDHMGSDLMVVNAARTSFGKESDWATNADGTYAGPTNHLKPEDASLIRYLATGYRTKEWAEFLKEIKETVHYLNLDHDMAACDAKLTTLLHAYKRRAQHWAPFAHPHLSLRMTLPMFLARQFVKHQIGGVWSEESRRYISDEPGGWFPDEWHSRPDDVKQGAGNEVVTHVDHGYYTYELAKLVPNTLAANVALYDTMVSQKVAPEEARIVLPLNTMTTVTWTGSLLFWSRVCNQRVDSHAQLAAQELGRQIANIVRPRYPVSWAALCGE